MGNLEPHRDWGFAGDYVEAMWLMLQQNTPDDFVISTGETHSVKEFLEEVWNVAELGDVKKHLKINKRLFRLHEVPYLLGDNSKARRVLGWNPKLNFYQLAELMYKTDLNEIGGIK